MEGARGVTSTVMGLGRVERPTSRLSGVRSNHLSYRPLPFRRTQKLVESAMADNRNRRSCGPCRLQAGFRSFRKPDKRAWSPLSTAPCTFSRTAMETPQPLDDRNAARTEHSARAGNAGSDMLVPLRTRRFTVAEYYRMAEVGILAPEERVELIDGEIIAMAAIGSRHAATVSRLTSLLVPMVAGRGLVRIQQPVRISELSEPAPDVTVVRPRRDHYVEDHPGPADTLLVVEVSDTTVEFDRNVKGPLYALARIGEYWLVNIPADAVEVYRAPAAAGYRDERRLRRGEMLRIGAFPDLTVTMSDILP
jgi:Uma2 family endonuclease